MRAATMAASTAAWIHEPVSSASGAAKHGAGGRCTVGGPSASTCASICAARSTTDVAGSSACAGGLGTCADGTSIEAAGLTTCVARARTCAGRLSIEAASTRTCAARTTTCAAGITTCCARACREAAPSTTGAVGTTTCTVGARRCTAVATACAGRIRTRVACAGPGAAPLAARAALLGRCSAAPMAPSRRGGPGPRSDVVSACPGTPPGLSGTVTALVTARIVGIHERGTLDARARPLRPAHVRCMQGGDGRGCTQEAQ